jgi:5-hydroxyisourate hydrolase
VGRLTTHVLDTANGRPAAGLRLTLFRVEGGRRTALIECTTNADGRCDAPLLEGDALAPGAYELVFQVGGYFGEADSDGAESGGAGSGGAGRPFLDDVPVRFGIADPGQHYHVPLLVSPFGYTTYRGS